MLVVGRQIRAARALLDMSQDELATSAGLTPQAIRKIESGDVQPREGTMADIVKVFSDRGIEFTDNRGLKFKPENIEVFEGPDRFDEFYEFIYSYLKQYGGDVRIASSDARLYAKYRRNPELHRSRMRDLVKRGDVTFRILARDGDHHLTAASYAKYRWQPEEQFAPTSFYTFGECLALVSFIHSPAPYVILIRSAPFAAAYQQSFDVVWQNAKEPIADEEEQKKLSKEKEN